MSLEEQTMIIEILYHHAFKQDKIDQNHLYKLLLLLQDFIGKNFHQLSLQLDWKPCFNTLFPILSDSETRMEMLTISDKKNNFYNLVEKLMTKLNKFFQQGAATEIFKETKKHFLVENSNFLSYVFLFSILVPTQRYNTNEEEVNVWLPFIFDVWKTCPYNAIYRSFFMRLFAKVTQYFSRLDFSEYNEWIAYQFNLAVTKSAKDNEMNPFFRTHSEKHFAEYYVNTFKSQEHLDADSKMQTDRTSDNGFESLMVIYRDYLHPGNKFRNKAALVHFLKYISTALCFRVRHERERISEDPDFKYKYLFLAQEDLSRFITKISPFIDWALQGENLLDKLSIALKNFIALDCDSILSLFLFSNFHELDGLTNSKFISILTGVVPGVLMNTQDDSSLKYSFISNVISYLLTQVKSLEVTILKNVISIFNSIWSVLPVLPATWGPDVVAQTSKSKDYAKYMRIMIKKRKQEYQFYKLYEVLESQANEYFELLVSVMNLGIPLKEELVKAFWYLFNAMPSSLYTPLATTLLSSANPDHAKGVVGLALGNLAARDQNIAKQITQEALNKLIVEEDGVKVLAFNNYAITEYYLSVLNIVIYHSKQAVTESAQDAVQLLKLLVKDAEEDLHRKNVGHLIKAILKPFNSFTIISKDITQKEVWGDLEYQSKFWINIGKLDSQMTNFGFNFEEITVDDIKQFVELFNTHILPWLKDISSAASDKTSIRTVAQVLTETHLNVSKLLPSKKTSEKTNFTLFYYNHIGVDSSLIDALKKIEADIFEMTEVLHEKITNDEALKRDEGTIQHIGTIYKQIVSSSSLSLKDKTFNEERQMNSMLQYGHIKQLESSILKQIGHLITSLSVFGGADYDSEDKL